MRTKTTINERGKAMMDDIRRLKHERRALQIQISALRAKVDVINFELEEHIAERARRIAKLHANGRTFREIGDLLGLSSPRVAQIHQQHQLRGQWRRQRAAA
jgi:DNA-directed RNA polymerase specialized sigma subunit